MRKHRLASLMFLTPALFAGVTFAAPFMQPLPPDDAAGAARLHLCGAGREKFCCKEWERTTCAEEKDGKCVKWNYRCKRMGRPPCRER